MDKLVICDKVKITVCRIPSIGIKMQDTGYFYYLVSCWHLFGLKFIPRFLKSIRIL